MIQPCQVLGHFVSLCILFSTSAGLNVATLQNIKTVNYYPSTPMHFKNDLIYLPKYRILIKNITKMIFFHRSNAYDALEKICNDIQHKKKVKKYFEYFIFVYMELLRVG